MQLPKISWETLCSPKIFVMGGRNKGKTTLLQSILLQCHGNQPYCKFEVKLSYPYEYESLFGECVQSQKTEDYASSVVIWDADLHANLLFDLVSIPAQTCTFLMSMQYIGLIPPNRWSYFDYFALCRMKGKDALSVFYKHVLKERFPMKFSPFLELAMSCYQKKNQALVVKNPLKDPQQTFEETFFFTEISPLHEQKIPPVYYGEKSPPLVFGHIIEMLFPKDIGLEIWSYLSHGDCSLCSHLSKMTSSQH